MRKNGLEVKEEYIITEEARFESAGYKAMNRLFNEGKVPTAILAAYDNIAIGAMKSIYEHGVKIPEDISVIGFDDIKELPYLNVPLSSITAYNEDLCEILVNFIFEIINKKNGDAIKTIKLSKRLIKRESVGKAPRR